MNAPAGLPAFQAILQTGSVDGRATQPHLSQPAVSACFRGPEGRLGAAPNRRARPVAPTLIGRRLLNRGTR